MTVLYITRKYPPSVGGMQEYAYQLYRRLDRRHETIKLSLGRSQRHLVWFLPWALVAGLTVASTRPVTHVHVGDALLAPLGLLLARTAGAKASVTTYGLDVVYPPTWYQRLVRAALPKFQDVICISRATRRACLDRGVPAAACHVVPPGTTLWPELSPDVRSRARQRLGERASRRPEGNPLLLVLGRHVRRKGFEWFIEAVMPTLPDSARLIMAGDGPRRSRVEEAASAPAVRGRVDLRGRVSERDKQLLLRAADVFVMPNRRISGDMEGFGLVALEASAVGTPVVAADIEGIRDAVLDGDTGRLVPEGNAETFAAAIREVMEWDRRSVKNITEATFSWWETYRGYERALDLSGDRNDQAAEREAPA